MAGNVDSPRFTVEQIELIRRLRNSGITKEQVIQAFDSFSRLDSELGTLYNTSTLGNHGNSLGLYTNAINRCPAEPIAAQPTFSNENSHQRTTQTNAPGQMPPSQGPSTRNTRNVWATQMNTGSQGPGHGQIWKDLQPGLRVREIQPGSSPREVKRARRDSEGDVSNCSFEDDRSSHSSDVILFDQLQEESSRQEAQKLHNQIQEFVSQHNIKSSIISAMTGLNSNQILHYLTPDGYVSKSSQFLKSIHSWYKTYKPVLSLGSASPVSGDGQPVPVALTKVPMSEGLDTFPTQAPTRKERFTFRQKHLEILESSFKENPYPSADQRDAIAAACNLASSDNGRLLLQERETLNGQMIHNWFANRRKEVKKIAREEGVDATSTLLPSRLQPKVPHNSGVLPSRPNQRQNSGNRSTKQKDTDIIALVSEGVVQTSAEDIEIQGSVEENPVVFDVDRISDQGES